MFRLTLMLCLGIGAAMVLAGKREDDSGPSPTPVALQAPEPERPAAATGQRGAREGVTFDPVGGRAGAQSGSGLVQVASRDAPAGRRAAPSESDATHVVTGSVVNMRAGPSTARAVVGQLAEGAPAEMLERTGTGWAKIRAARSGETGYMAADFLSPIQ